MSGWFLCPIQHNITFKRNKPSLQRNRLTEVVPQPHSTSLPALMLEGQNTWYFFPILSLWRNPSDPILGKSWGAWSLQCGRELQAAQESMWQGKSLSFCLVPCCFPTRPCAIDCCVSMHRHSPALTASCQALSLRRLRAQPSCYLRYPELGNIFHMENNGCVSGPHGH